MSSDRLLKQITKPTREGLYTQAELDRKVAEARYEAFKEVLSTCNDNDEAGRKWSRGDFIKYMKYELGWNDRSGKPINDPFPDALTREDTKS